MAMEPGWRPCSITRGALAPIPARGSRWPGKQRSAWHQIMADRLTGYRVLILETREEAQFSRLLTERGADVVQCPMFTIVDAPDSTPVAAWIRHFVERPCDDL